MSKRLLDADIVALRAMRTRGHTKPLETAARWLSVAGEHGGVWLAISTAGAARGNRAYRRAGITVASAYAVNQLTKVAIRRRRPALDGLPALVRTTTNLSYPSAHATTSFAGARALSALLPAAPLYALAAAITLSRPYLGVHYPSDIVAGSALGLALVELLT